MQQQNKRKRLVLSVATKLEICDAVKKKVQNKDIMRQYNVGLSTITDIKASEAKLR